MNDDGQPYVRPEARAWFETLAFRQGRRPRRGQGRHRRAGVWAGSATRSGRPSAPRRATSTTRTSAATSTTSTRRNALSSTASAGRTRTATASARTAAATPSRSPSSRTRATASARTRRASSRTGCGASASGAEVQVIDFGELVGQLSSTYDWEAVVIGFTGGPDPYGGHRVLAQRGGPAPCGTPNQPEPSTDWEAEIDDLYTQAVQRARPRGARADVPPGAGDSGLSRRR